MSTSLPQLDGELALEGLSAPVSVSRDPSGVPYIKAQSEADAYFALGFVHAQDRLAQMELMRRQGAGRLAELVGATALPSDRSMRVFGIYRQAEADVATLPADVRAALESYATGVNAFMARRDGALPLEIQLLWHEPEPWRLADSLVWGRLMALKLTDNWYTELFRARLARSWPRERIDALWPPYPEDAPVSISVACEGPCDTPAPTTMPAGMRVASLPAALGEIVDPDAGSNAWAVAGERTTTGRPILANDPHLGFSLPNLWYLAHIETPGWRIAGATVPGVPFTVLGHNGTVAWGLTTTHSDAADVFVEKLDPNDPGRYLTPGGSAPFESSEETIRVRWGADEKLVRRTTRHGPVVSDAYDGLGDDGQALALAHTGLLPGDLNLEALYRAGRAKSWGEFTRALQAFRSPMQNVMYADTAGNIGLHVAARLPIRAAGDGSMPAPGWTGTHDWTGFVPFEELPHVLNPPAGRLVNANNKVVGPGYPHFLARDWPEPWRAARIEQFLSQSDRHDPADSTALQLDLLSPAANVLLPRLTAAQLSGERAAMASEALRNWDGRMDPETDQPLIYEAWVRELVRGIFADDLGGSFREWWSDRPSLLLDVLGRDTSWCDDIGTEGVETCEFQVVAAFDRGLVSASERFGDYSDGWRWGQAHRAHFAHDLLGRLPVIGPAFTWTIETGGDNHTVNRGGMSLGRRDHPFAHVHGAGFRAVYDLANLSDSAFIQATGQSGNLLSPHFADLMVPWRNGAYIRLAPSPQPAHRLELVPEGR